MVIQGPQNAVSRQEAIEGLREIVTRGSRPQGNPTRTPYSPLGAILAGFFYLSSRVFMLLSQISKCNYSYFNQDERPEHLSLIISSPGTRAKPCCFRQHASDIQRVL